jgi:hypothetical protein
LRRIVRDDADVTMGNAGTFELAHSSRCIVIAVENRGYGSVRHLVSPGEWISGSKGDHCAAMLPL